MTGRGSRASRTVSIARRGAVRAMVGAMAMAVYWSAGTPIEAARGVRGSNFDAALGHAAGLGAWLAAGWLSLGLAMVAASSLPGLAGTALETWSVRLVPRTFRRAAQVLLGLSLLAGPLVATSAIAAPGPPGPGPTATAAIVIAPSLDRPMSGVAPVSAAPIITLDRPSSPRYVAPSPPPAPVIADPGPTRLLTGVAARATADDGVVVRRGDTLWELAARHLGARASAADIARAWPRWYAANRRVIGADPAFLLPGQLLYPPT
jgi:hypothetical protein